MTLAVRAIAGEPAVASWGSRREFRVCVLRQVEYSRFPREQMEQRPRLGLTRDISGGGLCLRVPREEPVGALLRVRVLGLDGAPERHALARVVWTQPAGGGSHWLGLHLLTP